MSTALKHAAADERELLNYNAAVDRSTTASAV